MQFCDVFLVFALDVMLHLCTIICTEYGAVFVGVRVSDVHGKLW